MHALAQGTSFHQKKYVEGKEYMDGLINYIDIKAKCGHLKNLPVKGFCGRFIDWIYSQSCWYEYISTQLCELLPL
jgi:hypothetical protein